MNTVTLDELKANPHQTLEMFYQTGDPCLIKREDNRNLVVLSEQTYDAIMRHMKQTGQTVAEIESRYADQWVLMKETEWDKQGNPLRGVVVAHSPDREALTEPVKQLRRENPGVKTYIFFAGSAMPENVTVMI
jgi:PHD/YefM family antitoxin component YafN of YafNO toxin-antitoxin module